MFALELVKRLKLLLFRQEAEASREATIAKSVFVASNVLRSI
jgi:hypothetical protein